MHYPDTYYGFAFKEFLSITTAGSIAETIGFPLNTVKVRLQLQGEHLKHDKVGRKLVYYKGTLDAIRKIINSDGLRGLFTGLAQVYKRQVIYNGIRALTHYPVRNLYYQIAQNRANVGVDNICVRLPTNLTTAAIGVLCVQPVNVVKLNLQNVDCAYKSSNQVVKCIILRDGLKGLWRGWSTIFLRSCVYISVDTIYFNKIEDKLINEYKFRDFSAYLCTSLITCGLIVFLSNPVDVIRTRYITAHPNEYSGVLHCVRRTLYKEGPAAFYRGFAASFYFTLIWDLSIHVLYERVRNLFDEI